jgi:hypothetical protein
MGGWYLASAHRRGHHDRRRAGSRPRLELDHAGTANNSVTAIVTSAECACYGRDKPVAIVRSVLVIVRHHVSDGSRMVVRRGSGLKPGETPRADVTDPELQPAQDSPNEAPPSIRTDTPVKARRRRRRQG